MHDLSRQPGPQGIDLAEYPRCVDDNDSVLREISDVGHEILGDPPPVGLGVESSAKTLHRAAL